MEVLKFYTDRLLTTSVEERINTFQMVSLNLFITSKLIYVAWQTLFFVLIVE
jgi:hypothetical protein